MEVVARVLGGNGLSGFDHRPRDRRQHFEWNGADDDMRFVMLCQKTDLFDEKPYSLLDCGIVLQAVEQLQRHPWKVSAENIFEDERTAKRRIHVEPGKCREQIGLLAD